MTEEAKVVKELERHWDERPGAGVRKVCTGVVPQALFAPQRMNVKIFKVDDMSSFLKVHVLRPRRAHFCEASFATWKIVHATATTATICKGHKWASDTIFESVHRTSAGRPFRSKMSSLRRQG